MYSWSCVSLLAVATVLSAASATAQTGPAAHRSLEPILERISSIHLVDNRVYLDREAASALPAASNAEAASLLVQALADLDAAQTSLRTQAAPDEQRLAELEFMRRPVLLQLVRISPGEGLRMLEQPQPADGDTEFQRLVFEQIAAGNGAGDAQGGPAAVSSLALRKLGHGLTPAVVAAYAVLQQRDPAGARVLAASMVARLGQQNSTDDKQCVQAAFGLLRLLRVDQGTRAPRLVINPALLDDPSMTTLFSFIADALIAAKEPELLVLPESPRLYVQAIEQYAPARADAVKALPFAAPDAKSLIFSHAPIDDGQPATAPPPALTAEQQQQNARRQEQYSAQLRTTAAEFSAVHATLAGTAATAEERDKAVWKAVDEANRSIAMGRNYAASLQPPEFVEGEYAFSHQGPLTGVIDAITGILQSYAAQHREAALRAAEGLDGSEVQMLVELKLAAAPAMGHAPQGAAEAQ